MSLPVESNRDLRTALLAGYLLLLVVLIAGSEIRRVGDGREYLDMALVVTVPLVRIVKGAGEQDPVPSRGRVLAVLSLVTWTGAIVAGRLMAYVK